MKEWGDPLFCIVGTSRQGSPPGTERNGESMATTKAKAGGAPSGGTAAVVAGTVSYTHLTLPTTERV